jgi:hypothetical protein
MNAVFFTVPLKAEQLWMTASPFETAASRPPQGEAVILQPNHFLILRASAASVSKDEEMRLDRYAAIPPSRGGWELNQVATGTV